MPSKQVNLGGKYLLKHGSLVRNPLTNKLGMKKRKLIVEIHAPIKVPKKDSIREPPGLPWPDACFQKSDPARSSGTPEGRNEQSSTKKSDEKPVDLKGVDVSAMMKLLHGVEISEKSLSKCKEELQEGETVVFRILRPAKNKKEKAKAKPIMNDDECSDDEDVDIDEASVSSLSTLGFQGVDEDKAPDLWLELSTFSIDNVAHSKRYGLVVQVEVLSEKNPMAMHPKTVSKYFVFRKMTEAKKFESIMQSLVKPHHKHNDKEETSELLTVFHETEEDSKEDTSSPKSVKDENIIRDEDDDTTEDDDENTQESSGDSSNQKNIAESKDVKHDSRYQEHAPDPIDANDVNIRVTESQEWSGKITRGKMFFANEDDEDNGSLPTVEPCKDQPTEEIEPVLADKDDSKTNEPEKIDTVTAVIASLAFI